jgi:hypothetical protein
MAHSSTRAAMIYIHGSDARQHEIADTLSQLARQELDPVLKAPHRPPWREAIGRSGHGRAGAPREGHANACRP